MNQFFTDIDFCMGGRPSTRLLFSIDLIGAEVQVEVASEEWRQLNRLESEARHLFGEGFVLDQSGETEKAFSRIEHEHTLWRERHQPLLQKNEVDKRQLWSAEDAFKSLQRHLDSLENKDGGTRPPLEVEAVSTERRRLAQLRSAYENAVLSQEDSKSAVEVSKKQEPRRAEKVFLDGRSLATKIVDSRNYVESTIDRLRLRRPSPDTLSQFISYCSRLFALISGFFVSPGGALAIGLSDSRPKRPVLLDTRLDISVLNVLESGASITVLGDAGAGKTTTLQMYAYRLLTDSRDQKKINIFASLARLIRIWKSKGLRDPRVDTPALEEGLKHYLHSLGYSISVDSLLGELGENGGCILLDGIDEVIHEAHWILRSAYSLAERLPLVQFVMSSRMTGNYLEKIPFMMVTLLQFTDGQRRRFIDNWFEHETSKVQEIENHLRTLPELNEITRNPLLVTLLCVLVQHGIELPTNEIRLYDERIRLLLGQYDLHKEIKRVHTHSTTLFTLLRHIAFRLHSEVKREETRQRFYQWSLELLGDQLDRTKCESAINELFDPCNLLVLSAEGRLGFGHLRFQEHLAAHEISINRGIPLLPLMRQSWWRGCFELYAQMHPDLTGLVKRIAESGSLEMVRDTIEAMIAKLSTTQQERVIKALRLKGDMAKGYDL